MWTTILGLLSGLWKQLQSSALPTLEALLESVLSGQGVPAGTSTTLLGIVTSLAESVLAKLGYGIAMETEGKQMEAFINAIPATTPLVQMQSLMVSIETAWTPVNTLISQARDTWWFAHCIVSYYEKSGVSGATLTDAQTDRDALRVYARSLADLRENTVIGQNPVLPTAPEAYTRLWPSAQALIVSSSPTPALPGA